MAGSEGAEDSAGVRGMIPDWANNLLERVLPEATWFDLLIMSAALWFSLGIVLRLLGVI